MQKHLTKAVVESARLPAAGQIFVRDDQIKGLALRVLATGAKTFIWEGRVKGRVRRMTLGQWPTVSVAVARAEAERIRVDIAAGLDPAEKRQAERHELTFGELRARYIKEWSKEQRGVMPDGQPRFRKRSWLRDERRLARCKAWDGRRLSDIGTSDAAKLQKRINAEHGPIEANRTLELLRAAFNKAKKWGEVEQNPALGFERFEETRRDRFLSDDELRRLNTALMKEPEPWRSYFPLLLLLGVRRSELAGARWSEVDLETGTVKLMRTKSGEPRLAPMPLAAVEMLRALPSLGTSEFLFPGSGKTGHLVEVKSAWARLCRDAKLTNVTIHDLRRTVGSRMAIAGENLPTIGSVLGHTGLNATQIYARLDIAAARRALEANAASLPLTLPTIPAADAGGAAK